MNTDSEYSTISRYIIDIWRLFPDDLKIHITTVIRHPIVDRWDNYGNIIP